jgi:hypothetical protein
MAVLPLPGIPEKAILCMAGFYATFAAKSNLLLLRILL